MSLRRLGVERIDLFQLHRIDPNLPLEDQIGVFAEACRRPARSVRSACPRSGGARGSTQHIDGRHRAEPVQPHGSQVRAAGRRLHRGGHRLHPVGAGRGGKLAAAAARWDGVVAGHRRHHPRRSRSRGCCPLAGDPADPGHLDRLAPRGERRGGRRSRSATTNSRRWRPPEPPRAVLPSSEIGESIPTAVPRPTGPHFHRGSDMRITRKIASVLQGLCCGQGRGG